MAGPPHDAEFWLPATFLTKDDTLTVMGRKETLKNMERRSFFDTELRPLSHGFPTEFPYEFDSLDSALISPVESVEGSTETDSSDEDEFFVGLSRRLTRSSSQKLPVPSLTRDRAEKNGFMASSPQSTLSGIGSWSVSGNRSPNSSSQVPSPPMTPFGAQNDAWDLIYAAAGQVARLKMNGEAPKCNNGALYGRALSRPQNQFPAKNQPAPGLYSNQNLAHNLFQSNQYQQARQDQLVKSQCGAVWGRQVRPNWQAQTQYQQPQIQGRARSNVGGCENARCGRLLSLHQSSWPALQTPSQPQQYSGSGMRAVFLGGSGGVKRECAGTGVFLPRRYGNPPENRKKSGCSTVLLPAKVVHALNLNLDEINSLAQPYMTTGYASNQDSMMAKINAALLAQQKFSYRPEGRVNQDLLLPQEWTY
ncbi:hypothetical protein SLE2022_108280 [Rubroshorea leprosula]